MFKFNKLFINYMNIEVHEKEKGKEILAELEKITPFAYSYKRENLFIILGEKACKNFYDNNLWVNLTNILKNKDYQLSINRIDIAYDKYDRKNFIASDLLPIIEKKMCDFPFKRFNLIKKFKNNKLDSFELSGGYELKKRIVIKGNNVDKTNKNRFDRYILSAGVDNSKIIFKSFFEQNNNFLDLIQTFFEDLNSRINLKFDSSKIVSAEEVKIFSKWQDFIENEAQKIYMEKQK